MSMDSGGAGSRRGGHCDACGRCCVWCIVRDELRYEERGRRAEWSGRSGDSTNESRDRSGDWTGESCGPRCDSRVTRSTSRCDGTTVLRDAQSLGMDGGSGVMRGQSGDGTCSGSGAVGGDDDVSAGHLQGDGDCDGTRFRTRDRGRRTWWSRRGQRILTEGVDCALDSQDGPSDDLVLLYASDDEAQGGCLSSLGVDDEVVPWTEFEDPKVQGSAKQTCSMDRGVDVSGHSQTDPAWERIKTDFLSLLVPGYSQCLKRQRK